MSKEVKSGYKDRKVIMTIKRPNGQIEEVVHPKWDYFTDDMWNQAVKAYKMYPEKGELLQVKFECIVTYAKLGINKEWSHWDGINEGGEGYNSNAYNKYDVISTREVKEEKIWK